MENLNCILSLVEGKVTWNCLVLSFLASYNKVTNTIWIECVKLYKGKSNLKATNSAMLPCLHIKICEIPELVAFFMWIYLINSSLYVIFHFRFMQMHRASLALGFHFFQLFASFLTCSYLARYAQDISFLKIWLK